MESVAFDLLSVVDRVESGRPHEDDIYVLAGFARDVLREIGLDPDNRSAVFPEIGSRVSL